MQKKLIAAAVAALASTAVMADATVYGRMDIGYSSASTQTGAAAKSKTTDTGTMSALTTSRLGVNFGEDLGGGMSAFGNLELGINSFGTTSAPDTVKYTPTTGSGVVTQTEIARNNLDSGAANDPFNTRTAYVGLKSDAAGSLTLGRQTTLVDQVHGLGNAGGLNNTVGSMYLGIGKYNNTRSSSLITYSSPKFGGVSFDAQIGQGESDAKNKAHDELGLRVSYSAGPVSVALGYSSETFEPASGGAATAEPQQMSLAATYDLGVVKLYGNYMDGENLTESKDGFELGITAPLGAVKLMATIYQATTSVSGADTNDHSGLQLGAMYSLSKRTTAYALYGRDTNETVPGAVETEKTQLALGVRHDF